MSLDYIQNIKLFPNLETTLMTLDRHEDNRGEFMQIWQEKLESIETRQINVSISNRGTLRGLHFQSFMQQRKLLTVLKGSIVDILVDIKPDSPTFGKFNYVNMEKGDQLLIPDKIAHGFLALEDETTVIYQVDQERCPGHEISIYPIDLGISHVYDESLNLNKLMLQNMVDHDIIWLTLSDKDNTAPKLYDFLHKQNGYRSL